MAKPRGVHGEICVSFLVDAEVWRAFSATCRDLGASKKHVPCRLVRYEVARHAREEARKGNKFPRLDIRCDHQGGDEYHCTACGKKEEGYERG